MVELQPEKGIEFAAKQIAGEDELANQVIAQLIWAAPKIMSNRNNAPKKLWDVQAAWMPVVMLAQQNYDNRKILLVYNKLCMHHVGAFITILLMVTNNIFKSNCLDQFFAQGEIEPNSAMVVDAIYMAVEVLGVRMHLAGWTKGKKNKVVPVCRKYTVPAFNPELRK